MNTENFPVEDQCGCYTVSMTVVWSRNGTSTSGISEFMFYGSLYRDVENKLSKFRFIGRMIQRTLENKVRPETTKIKFYNGSTNSAVWCKIMDSVKNRCKWNHCSRNEVSKNSLRMHTIKYVSQFDYTDDHRDMKWAYGIEKCYLKKLIIIDGVHRTSFIWTRTLNQNLQIFMFLRVVIIWKTQKILCDF